MIFYIRDRKTFKLKGIVEGASWKLVQSVWTDLTEMETTNNVRVASGDIIYTIDGWQGIIIDIERDNKTMQMKCQKIDYLLGRKTAYEGMGSVQPCEWTLHYLIRTNYMEQSSWTEENFPFSDPWYVIPYLNVNRVTTEASAQIPITERGLYKVSSYIAQCRRLANVFTYFDIDQGNDTLTARIQHENRNTKTLITTGMPVEVTQESFTSEELISKVTTYNFTDGYPPLYTNIQQWYLMSDGTITNNRSGGTWKEGAWALQELQEEDDAKTRAVNTIRTSQRSSHKIIVRVPLKDARFEFYDPVRVELHGHMYESYVSRKTISSDGYVEYTFGDLQTSLTDKINELD